MECTDLTEDTMKILGLHFSYNKKLEQEKNFLSYIFKNFEIMETKKLNPRGENCHFYVIGNFKNYPSRFSH